MNVTIFQTLKHINEPKYITVEQALERIKKGKSKSKIEQIRAKALIGEDYYMDKRELPFVMFSAAKTKETVNRKGNGTHREDESITEHSGFFALDFDAVDISLTKEKLSKDNYIYAYWVAPSGMGIKALVKCPKSLENHHFYYTAFLERYPELDTTSRNLSRGTYESYDPDLVVNPNSLVWDKRMSKEEVRKNKEKTQNRRGHQVLSTAVGMVRASYDGVKHETLLNACVLLGGYIATGRVDETIAIQVMTDEIRAKNPKDLEGAIKTITDGIAYGKQRPLVESKKIEKAQQFLRREDGSYDFLADDKEMTEYEQAFINGTLEMGLPTGMNDLNTYWMFKKHHLVWFGGVDSVGKSFLVWYLAVLAAKLHGWKVLIHSAENSDGQLRKKLKEFFIGKSLKVMDDEELTLAHDFVSQHFKIISSKQMHSLEDFLLKCEIIYDEGYQFDLVIGEPWNSFDIPSGIESYRNNIHCLNVLRVFKENYSSVWICDHVNTTAARAKDKDGYVLAPYKSDIESGQMKANKVDDFIMIHRVVNHPEKYKETQIHVHKVKDEETGGKKTKKDEPVIIELNADYCGYTCNGIDPIKHRKL